MKMHLEEIITIQDAIIKREITIRAKICQGNLVDMGLENFHCKSRETRSVLFEERKAQGGHHYFIYDSKGNS